VSASFQVRLKPYPTGYGSPLPFGRSGIRFSILPSPTGDLDFPRGRLIATLCQADLIGVYAFRMRKMRSRGCLLYAEIFGVLEPDPTTSSDRVQSHSSSSQPAHFDDLFSFDASTKIHFRSPVRPSPDPALPPGSGIYPWTSPTWLRSGRYRFSARAGWRRDRPSSRSTGLAASPTTLPFRPAIHHSVPIVWGEICQQCWPNL
jgi:hypothetical protein